jgi:hypothetical protein
VDVTSLGLPTYDELLRLWCEAAGVSYPPKELYWATAWHFLRVRTQPHVALSSNWKRSLASFVKELRHDTPDDKHHIPMLKYTELDGSKTWSSLESTLSWIKSIALGALSYRIFACLVNFRVGKVHDFELFCASLCPTDSKSKT